MTDSIYYRLCYLAPSNKTYWCLSEGQRSPHSLYQIPVRKTEEQKTSHTRWVQLADMTVLIQSMSWKHAGIKNENDDDG